MAIFEFNLPKNISKALGLKLKNPRGAQLRVLKKLLKRARYTAFGQKNKFDEILTSKHIGKKFHGTFSQYVCSLIFRRIYFFGQKQCNALFSIIF